MDGEDGDDLENSAAASEILPPILVLLPSLKSSDVNESAAAASEMVTLTNNTSAEEDTLVGRSGALEVLGQVICKGSEEGKIAAASALANLIANSDANKKSVMASPDVIPAILNLAILSEKGAAVSARALLNLVSSKEAVLLLCKIEGAIDKIGRLVLTGRMDTKEDATRLLDRMVAQVFLSFPPLPPRFFPRFGLGPALLPFPLQSFASCADGQHAGQGCMHAHRQARTSAARAQVDREGTQLHW